MQIIQIVPRQGKTDRGWFGHEVQSGFGSGEVLKIIKIHNFFRIENSLIFWDVTS